MAATILGTIAFVRGWSATRELLAFFITSSLLSHLPRNGMRSRPRRSAAQVLANGGVACAAWTLRLAGGPRPLDHLAAGSLAAAAADTWATEIGGRWGGMPRIITSGRLVQSGESGGVTIAGTIAAGGGALVMALTEGETRRLASIALGGFLGSLADSILGALLQARYVCRACGHTTEQLTHCGKSARLVSGYAWMTNDAVNALATLLGGALATEMSRGLDEDIRRRP